jgi:hypothetical protein
MQGVIQDSSMNNNTPTTTQRGKETNVKKESNTIKNLVRKIEEQSKRRTTVQRGKSSNIKRKARAQKGE